MWSGTGVVGTGLSTFYFTAGGTGMAAAVTTFFSTCKPEFPDEVTVTVQNTGDVLDDTTGEITGTWSEAAQAGQVGTASAAYALGVGVRVRWITAGRRHNRLVRGSTFLAPCGSQIWGNDGRLSTGAYTRFGGAAAALVADSGTELRVWSRPTSGGADGASHVVVSGDVVNQPAWLSSRKH